MKGTINELVKGLISGRRDCLARAITLIESSHRDHQIAAQNMLQEAISLQRSDPLKVSQPPTLRLGIAGPPGAGKSTFIEKLGMKYIQTSKQYKVAVIPVDPSSHISGGSILGDKTRMELLSRESNAYIRGSPTRGVLGGIAEHTADVISLCEIAGYNIVIIESVGLGQSEVDIDSVVDMMIMVVPPGGGDGLQASKKGIMEVADMVVINKADGALLETARHTKSDYSSAMQFIRWKYPFWQPPIMLLSALNGTYLDDVITKIDEFHTIMIQHNTLMKKRNTQKVQYMWRSMYQQVIHSIESDVTVQEYSQQMVTKLIKEEITPYKAATALLNMYRHKLHTDKDTSNIPW